MLNIITEQALTLQCGRVPFGNIFYMSTGGMFYDDSCVISLMRTKLITEGTNDGIPTSMKVLKN
jgi:hypothetical protein